MESDFIFCLQAVQIGLVESRVLIEAGLSWSRGEVKDLRAELIHRSNLSREDIELLDKNVDCILRKHGGDISKSLHSFGEARRVFESLGGALSPGNREKPPEEPPPVGEKKPLDEVNAQLITEETPGRYTIRYEHGRGGIGKVFVAFDEHVGRDIAVKELLLEPSKGTPGTPARLGTEAAARFLREARITGQLEHPSIVPVYEIGRHATGKLYYTMKMVRGKTLLEAIQDCASLSKRLKLLSHFVNLGNAIAYAHSRGVLHRDIKPQNVMIGEFGETVVLDWGLAKPKGAVGIEDSRFRKEMALLKDAAAGKSVDGEAIGTPEYMPPEQAWGELEQIDERSDVYSLGAVLCALLTGKPPFEGDSPFEVIGKVQKYSEGKLTLTPVHSEEEALPPELWAIVEKALAPRREKRYSSAKELVTEVEAYLEGKRVGAYQYGSWEILKLFISRHKAATAAVTGVLATVLLAGMLIGLAYQEAVKNELEAKKNLAEAFIKEARSAEQNHERAHAAAYFAAARKNWDRLDARVGVVENEDQAVFPDLRIKGHKGRVTSVAFSPDGKTLASGGYDKTLRWWDVATGKELLPSTEHESEVHTLAFSPDGALLASGARDGTLYLWRPSTKESVLRIQAHTEAVQAVAFSPDGKTVASGGRDTAVRLWDAASGNEKRHLRGHEKPVSSLAFSHDGRFLASSGDDETVRFWDLSSGMERAKGIGHEGPVRSIAFSPDGKLLASGGRDKRVFLWRVPTGEKVGEMSRHEGSIQSVGFSHDGTLLATGGYASIVRLFEVATGEEVARVGGHDGPVHALAFSPDGTRFASGSQDCTVRLWKLPSKRSVFKLGGQEEFILALAFSPDGKALVFSRRDNTIRRLDAVTGDLVWQFEKPALTFSCLAFSPDGKLLALGGRETLLRLLDAATGKEEAALPGSQGRFRSLAFSPDGRLLASGSHDHTIRLWDMSLRVEKARLSGHGDRVNSVAFSPDGRVLASGSEDQTVRLWDTERGKETACLTAQGPVNAVAFSPDGKSLASASKERVVQLWDLLGKKLLKTLSGHSHIVTSVAFSPDGKRLASGSHDATARVWEVATGEEVARFYHPPRVSAAVFSPDGRMLALSSSSIRLLPFGQLSRPEEDFERILSKAKMKLVGAELMEDFRAYGETDLAIEKTAIPLRAGEEDDPNARRSPEEN
jgi:eukaryotic-like serine/threonine-protein kinase